MTEKEILNKIFALSLDESVEEISYFYEAIPENYSDIISDISETEQLDHFWVEAIKVLILNYCLENVDLQFTSTEDNSYLSLSDFIQKTLDLDRREGKETKDINYLSKFFNSQGDQTTNPPTEANFWNDSMNEIIKKIVLIDGNEDEIIEMDDCSTVIIKKADSDEWGVAAIPTGIVVEPGGKFDNSEGYQVYLRVTDVKENDAGYDFDFRFVNPWYNTVYKTYLQVRTDEILSVLKNADNLQFTHKEFRSKKIPTWTRLLLPTHIRAVEIEDLNRNFWVIGQGIAAISAYLVGEGSILRNLLLKLFDEAAQLWDNMALLWDGVYKISQPTKYGKDHIEVAYFNKDIYSTNSFKRDNGWIHSLNNNDNINLNGDNIKQQLLDENELLKYCQPLIDQYSECNLHILPVFRIYHYDDGKCCAYFLPGFIDFFRNTKEFGFKPFVVEGSSSQGIEINLRDNVITGSNSLSSLLWYLCETDNYYYYYKGKPTGGKLKQPEEALNEYYDGESNKALPYYCGLRPEFSIKSFSSYQMEIKFYDYVKEIITHQTESQFEIPDPLFSYTSDFRGGNINMTFQGNSVGGIDATTLNELEIKRGFYINDIISYIAGVE